MDASKGVAILIVDLNPLHAVTHERVGILKAGVDNEGREV